MKKGKRLLILLLTVLTMVVAFSVTSFAADSQAEYTGSVGYCRLEADNADYNKGEHRAELKEVNIVSKADNPAEYGTLSKINYYEVIGEGNNEQEVVCDSPVNAGHYRAKVTITIHTNDGTSSSTSQEELSVDYYINQVAITSYNWIDKNLVYNGKPQFPVAKADGVNGTKLTLVPQSTDPDEDPCIDAGWHTAEASLSEADAVNYILNVQSTHEYEIKQKALQLDWYRPVYNENGEETGETVKVGDNTVVKLVYNGQEQCPEAKIRNLVTDASYTVIRDGVEVTETTDDTDKVTVIVEGGGTKVSMNTSKPYYIAKATALSGERAHNYSINVSKQFQILPRPVILKWGYTPGADEDPEYATQVDPDKSGYDYKTTYNGVEQTPFVEVVNAAVNEDREKEEVTAAAVLTNEPENANKEAVSEDRIYTDASVYKLEAGKLSNERNYTYFRLNTGLANGDLDFTEEKVADCEAVYTIDPYKVRNFVWDEDSLTKVYNASYQEPKAKLSDNDLQGPDTDEEVAVVIAPEREEARPVDVGEYRFRIFVLSYIGDVDRSANYTYVTEGPDRTNGLRATLTITPADLTVTANNNTIKYRMEPSDKGVRYSGLLNGKTDPSKCSALRNNMDGVKRMLQAAVKRYVITQADADYFLSTYEGMLENNKAYYNTDERNGVPTVGEQTGVFVDASGNDVEASEAISIRQMYAKNGKPGSYAMIPYLRDGYSAPNYNVKFVNGTLKVNDVASVLVAKGTKKGSRGIKLSWNSVSGAASYDVYMSQCSSKGKVRTPKFVKNVRGNSLKVKKLKGKKLKAKTCYKYYVVAKDSSGKVITRSILGHFITGNVKGKEVNAKSMRTNTSSVTVGKGGTARVSASFKKSKAGKKYKLLNNSHHPLTRFVSENPSVATVDANGIVYGADKGWCRVYVQGVSGMWSVVEVYVK